MKLNKDTLYWARGCLTGTDENGELKYESVKDYQKLTVHNWLKNIPKDRQYDIVEVRFKNTRKVFFKNESNLPLNEGDIVAVESSPGHDIGMVSVVGPIAELKFKKQIYNNSETDLKKIYRLARSSDIEKWQEAVSLEYSTMISARKHAASLGLNMKIGDVEFQGDKTKAIFYYIAEERVDFRQLIKVLADDFKIRIEMRQIGARQEAGLIGGIGPCGKELCCAKWMTRFVSVSTVSARNQDLSVNPIKLAGQCGKLKCCLNFEEEVYLDALKQFPKLHGPLELFSSQMFMIKADALKKAIWFSSSPTMFANVAVVPIKRVKEILELNKKGIKPESLMADNSFDVKEELPSFKSAVGEDSLTRFDKFKGAGKKSKRTPKRRTGEDTADAGRTSSNKAPVKLELRKEESPNNKTPNNRPNPEKLELRKEETPTDNRPNKGRRNNRRNNNRRPRDNQQNNAKE